VKDGHDEAERTGLKHVAGNAASTYDTEETLGGRKYFTAVYPDVAVAPACVTCHNAHKDSPRTDFEMGGVTVRTPLN
jgi:hypothetical protein